MDILTQLGTSGLIALAFFGALKFMEKKDLPLYGKVAGWAMAILVIALAWVAVIYAVRLTLDMF